MRRPTRSLRCRPNDLGGRSTATARAAAGVLAGALLLLASPAAAAANPIVPVGSTHAELAVGLGAAPSPLVATFGFFLNEPQRAYVKVLPTPDNPVYRNGVIGQSGWWTDVALRGGNNTSAPKSTDGRGNVELGTLDAGVNYTLELAVHAPADAFRAPKAFDLAYSLAGRAVEANGSGAVRDPSVGLQVRLTVGDPSAVALSDDGLDGREKATLAGAAAALGVAALVVVAVRRGRRARKENEKRGP